VVGPSVVPGGLLYGLGLVLGFAGTAPGQNDTELVQALIANPGSAIGPAGS
jgi:hypothetical protein